MCDTRSIAVGYFTRRGCTTYGTVYLKERPNVVVFMANYELEQEGKPVIRCVSRLLYEFFWRRGRATKYGTYR